VLKAAATAARWHAEQKSKGASGAPYINHLLEVASLVAEATNAKDPNLIVAALLHDAIEDQEVACEEIAKRFGDDVASLVAEVTDDKTLPSRDRKRLQIEHAPKISRRAKILKLADKVSNIRSIASDPPDWSDTRKFAYIQWGRAVVAGLRGASLQLERQFLEAAREAEDSIAGHRGTQVASTERKPAMKKTNHQKEHPPKWNPGNSERGKVVGTAKHGRGHSAPRNPPSKTVKKERRVKIQPVNCGWTSAPRWAVRDFSLTEAKRILLTTCSRWGPTRIDLSPSSCERNAQRAGNNSRWRLHLLLWQ
jgi:guanosine-3',5'-bis(diphosphate) 3'-pyrophosphohydrolase